jgi:hypothetical protein
MDKDEAFFKADIQEGRRLRVVQPHRVLLTLAVVFALGWLAWPALDEVAYHFSEPAALDLGDVTLLGQQALPAERYVRVTGVLGNKAALVSGAFRPGSYRRGPVQLRQLLGSHIFAEFDQGELGERYTSFKRVTLEGRLVDFGPHSELAPARQYFLDRFGMVLPDDARVLIVGERPGQLWGYALLLALCALLSLVSVGFLVKSMREQVVDDDD